MNRTLKVLGLGLVAALAMSAFTVLGASANLGAHTGGHLTTDGNPVFPVKIHGHGGDVENPHKGTLTAFGQEVKCTETYSASVTSATSTSLTVTPTYTNCNSNTRHVNMRGCTYTFTIRDTNVSTLHNDVHLVCPPGVYGPEITTTDNSCTITFPAQTITNAVTYTTVTVGGKHAITVDFTAQNLTYTKHGLCEFLAPFGTPAAPNYHHGASLHGTALVKGTDAIGNPTGITATGRNGH